MTPPPIAAAPCTAANTPYAVARLEAGTRQGLSGDRARAAELKGPARAGARRRRWRPGSPAAGHALSHRSASCTRSYPRSLAGSRNGRRNEVGLLEQRVMADADEDPQEFLEPAVRGSSRAVDDQDHGRAGQRNLSAGDQAGQICTARRLELMRDVLDQYETVTHISDS